MVDSKLNVVVDGEDKLSPIFDNVQSRLIRFVGAVSSALTAIQIASFPVNAIRGFEKELANVQKTTGFTTDQIKTLGDQLVDMSRNINVVPEELAKIAAAAGQQGLGGQGVEGIRQFTESVSRMASVLDLTAEQAGTEIGKIASIFKIPLREIERAVSSFNETSNNSTASGEQLLDVVRRIGDAAGSLNLQQSIGVAATGIDLGLSPEVVGTSFSKIFSEMYAQADKFSKLLGTDVKTWMTTLQTDGVTALKQYLKALRGLDQQNQQALIKKLSGGGRIGVLVTKLLQDTEDSLLDSRVASAAKGFETGTSALKEQQTVLQTLDAEMKKAANSFTALGIKAGEQFVRPLAAYFAELNKGLSNPAVIQFAQAVGQSFLDLFNQIERGVQFVAALNVNWENFIVAGKVIAGLKLAQVIGAMATKIPGVGAAWQGLTQSATEAAAAQERAAGAGSGYIAGQVAKIKEMSAAYQEVVAKQKAVKAAEADLARAQLASTAAQGIAKDRGVAAGGAQDAVNAASAGISRAREAVAAAQQAAAAQTAAAQAALNQRIERAEAEHQARLASIQTEWAARQQAGRDNNSRAEVLAATRWKKEQETLEQAYYARSLTGIQAYYTRRIALAQSSGAAEVQAQQAAFAASLTKFDDVASKANVGKLSEQFEAAGVAAANASTNVANAAEKLSLAQRAAIAAEAGFSRLAVGVRIAAIAMQTFVAIAGKVFFWATVLYSVLDALGVTEKLGGYFQQLTDAVGLTSEAKRKAATEAKTLAEEQAKEQKIVDDLTASYTKLKDATTGRLSTASQEQLKGLLKSEDQDSYKKGLDSLVNQAAGAYAKLAELQKNVSLVPVKTEQLEKDRAEAMKQLDALQKELASRMERYSFGAKQGGFGEQQMIKEAEDAVKAQTALVKGFDDQIGRLGTTAQSNIQKEIATTAQDITQLKGVISDVFTPESAELFARFIPQYIARSKDAQKALDDLKAAQDALTAAGKDGSKEATDVAQAQVDNALLAVGAAKSAVTDIQTQMGAAINELKANGGLSAAAIGSLDTLPNFFNFLLPQLENMLNLVGQIKTEGGTFTGKLSGPANKPSSGEGTFKTQTDAEARRLSRAKLELARAEIQAEGNLRKQALEERQKDEDHSYQLGLISIKDYYASRLDILKAQNAIEMQSKQQELKAIDVEINEAKEESDKIRAQASKVRAQGEIDLLAKQRDALNQEIDRDMGDALRAFSDKIVQQRRSLSEYFGGGSDEEEFKTALEAAAAADRQFVDELISNSQDMPELLPVIDKIKQKETFDATEAVLSKIRREGDLTQRSLTNNTNKIAALQDAGLLTTQQAIKLNKQAADAEIAYKEAQIQRNLVAIQGLDQSSLRYKELTQDIKDAQAEIEILKLKGDEVAKSINDSLKTAIQDGLKSWETGEASFGEAVTQVLTDLGNAMLEQINKTIAENFLQSVGSVGSGGFGGFFSDLLGGATDKLGSTPLNPLYTKSVDASAIPGVGGEGGNGLLGKAADAVGLGGDNATSTAEGVANVADKGFFSDAFEGLTNTFSTVGSSITSGLGTVGSTIVGGVGSGLNLLMGVFQSVGSAIVAAIFSSSASEATSSAVSSIGMAAAAHNGGILGRTTMSRGNINSGVFAGAVRYHTGGVVGLKPNEVPLIGEKGEEMLTKDDPRHRDNLGKNADNGGGDSGSPIFNVQPVLSEETILDAMKGRAGEKLLIVHINKNPQAFRTALRLDK